MSTLTVTTCQGNAMRPLLDALARLRIEVFRDFPYLYAGDPGYEADYLARYAANPNSLFVLAYAGERLVGAATGQPMRDEVPEFRQPFEQADDNVEDLFYYGESVLEHAYRGRGIGKAFMAEREQHAQQQGFGRVAFCAVQRPAEHPARPADYQPLDGFWSSRGYRPRSDLIAHFGWQDLGEATETEKPLMFWVKSLT